MSTSKLGRNPFETRTRQSGSRPASPAKDKSRVQRVRKPIKHAGGFPRFSLSFLSTAFIRIPVFSLACAFTLGAAARGLLFRPRIAELAIRK